MSIDKFIMRGMTGSLGSGGDNWVSKVTPPSQNVQTTNQPHSSGSSFVMGGGGLGKRPSKTESSHEKGADDSWRSFDGRCPRDQVNMRKGGAGDESFRRTSFAEALFTKRGQRFVASVVMYGAVIFSLIFVLYGMFGDGESEHFYSVPSGLSPHARPMWDR
jgi:hypothetical protein